MSVSEQPAIDNDDPPRFRHPIEFYSDGDRIAYITRVRDLWEDGFAAVISDDEGFDLVEEYALHGWREYIEQAMTTTTATTLPSGGPMIGVPKMQNRNLILNNLFCLC